MRRWLSLVVGVLIGQWLAFSGHQSPAHLHMLGAEAWERRHYGEALVLWSQAAALQPSDPVVHYRRATALVRLGHANAAADAFRLVLLLDPPAELARLAVAGLAGLGGPSGTDRDTTVPVEANRGVWVAAVVLNDARPARFLVDTGSSVTLVSPSLAATLGLGAIGTETMELQTLAGSTMGPVATIASLRVGAAELRDVPVVVHDPGPGIDGILGNTVLARYRLTLDADRRLLHLRRPSAD